VWIFYLPHSSRGDRGGKLKWIYSNGDDGNHDDDGGDDGGTPTN
jgi:hypothetical protein